MTKGVLVLVCLLCSVVFVHGQDLITRTDGKIIKAKVLDVQPTTIRFRMFGSTDSLVYQIRPSDVQIIQMEDGTTRTFSAPITQGTGKKKGKEQENLETDFRRNVLSIYPFDFLYSNLTFAYERISATGKTGIKVPIVIGIDKIRENYANSFRENALFGAGLEVNFYPEGQGDLRYYITPAVNYRAFEYFYYQPTSPEMQKETASMITLAFKGGAFYQLLSVLQVSADVGIGYRSFHYPEHTSGEAYYFERSKVYLPANVNLGFRF